MIVQNKQSNKYKKTLKKKKFKKQIKKPAKIKKIAIHRS